MAQFASVDVFLSALPAMAAEHADKLQGHQGCIALAVTGGNTVAYSLQPDGSVARVNPAVVKPDCTIRAAENDLLALVNGTLSPVKALLTGRVKAEGDVSLLKKLMKLFA